MAHPEYRERRKRLSQALPKDAIALIGSAKAITRSGDSHFPFRQNSHFYYLTGSLEPDSMLLIDSEGRTTLFNPPRDKEAELWNGKRLGQEDAVLQLGVDEAFSYDLFPQMLKERIASKSLIYSPREDCFLTDLLLDAQRKLRVDTRRGESRPKGWMDLSPILGELRLFKTDFEITCLKKAQDISIKAHKRVMQKTPSLKYEYELYAEFIYEATRLGCEAMAYEPIVGVGKNACTLHYTENRAPLVDGALLLIDAGGEFQNYAADITRTFPVNGRFTPQQRALYEVVREAQQQAILEIKPGLPWNRIQEKIVLMLCDGLISLKILKGSLDEVVEKGDWKAFYPHSSGHWLGLDVHDVGSYRDEEGWRKLASGMVLTVEPGIYIPEGSPADPSWWNIGIRIEDDLLVTEKGAINLTASLPSHPDEVEACMRG